MQIKPLLQTPQPYKHESFSGFILRVAEANHYDSTSWISDILRAEVERRSFENSKTHIREPSILSQLLNVSDRALEMTYVNTSLLTNSVLSDGFPRGIIAKSARICPECLIEEPYIRWAWEFNISICLTHRCLLITKCSKCKKSINWRRPPLTCCECGFDFRNSHIERVDTDQFPITYYIHKILDLPIKSDIKEPLNNMEEILTLNPYKFMSFLAFFADKIKLFTTYKERLDKCYRLEAKYEREIYESCKHSEESLKIKNEDILSFMCAIDNNFEYEMDVKIYGPNAETLSSALFIVLDSSRFREFIRLCHEFHYSIDSNGRRARHHNNRVVVKDIIHFFVKTYREYLEQIEYWLKKDFQEKMYELLRCYNVHSFKVSVHEGSNYTIKKILFEEFDSLLAEVFQNTDEQKPSILDILCERKITFHDVDLVNECISLIYPFRIGKAINPEIIL